MENKKEKVHGGARTGSGRKPGLKKISTTIRIDKDLLVEIKNIPSEENFTLKIESAIKLYIKKKERKYNSSPFLYLYIYIKTFYDGL